MLLEIRDGSVSRNGQPVLSHFDFYIKGTEKAAIVGRNGAGKTTLVDVLTGEAELEEDPGNPASGIHYARKITVAKLGQQAVTHPEWTAEEALYAGKDAEGRLSCDRLFTGFGFSLEEKTKKIGAFSGGEQTKIMLISTLVAEPDILILDEPTNHLDLETTEWLEEYLCHYPKAVVVVSHDRYFLDRFAEVVFDVTGGSVVRYTGNYTQFREEKTERERRQRKVYAAQQAEVERLDALIEKFRHRPRKAAFARSRATILKRMEKIPAPEADDAVIHTGDILPAKRGSRVVLECEHLQIGYGDAPVQEIDLRLLRGRKVGIFGPNGSGKTTFLKTITGQIPPLKGKLQIGENIETGYYDQLTGQLRSEKNVFDWFHDRFPLMTGKEVRAYLAGYLFSGADLGKKVSSLSGGEKARLSLAAILGERPNCLVLDEPTNNMDIPAKETLESIFRDYQGTMLFVSHDRYFLGRVADSLLLFGEGEKAVYYPFGYEHYAERKRRLQEDGEPSPARSAEDQRLIESLRAVPKGSCLPRALSTRAAQEDWEFGLNREAREKAEQEFRMADQACSQTPETEEEWGTWSDPAAAEKREALREEKRKAWTETCLSWYDLWLEDHADGREEQLAAE